MTDGSGTPRSRDVGRPRQNPIEIVIDGQTRDAYSEELLLATLLAHGHMAISKDLRGNFGGPYCGMGVCFACNVFVDGAKRRACATLVRQGMSVRTRLNLEDIMVERR